MLKAETGTTASSSAQESEAPSAKRKKSRGRPSSKHIPVGTFPLPFSGQFESHTDLRLQQYIRGCLLLSEGTFQVVIEHENDQFFVLYTNSGNSIRLRLRYVSIDRAYFTFLLTLWFSILCRVCNTTFFVTNGAPTSRIENHIKSRAHSEMLQKKPGRLDLYFSSPFYEAINRAAVGKLVGLEHLLSLCTGSLQAEAIQKRVSVASRGRQVPFIDSATHELC